MSKVIPHASLISVNKLRGDTKWEFRIYLPCLLTKPLTPAECNTDQAHQKLTYWWTWSIVLCVTIHNNCLDYLEWDMVELKSQASFHAVIWYTA